MPRPRIAQILLEGQPGTAIEVAGWVRTRRDNKGGFSFIELNDGSCMSNLQIVVDSSVPGYTETIKLVTYGATPMCSVSSIENDANVCTTGFFASVLVRSPWEICIV